MDNYIIINETEHDGFKVISYIENLSAEERMKRDNQLSRTAIKLLYEKSGKQSILQSIQKTGGGEY